MEEILKTLLESLRELNQKLSEIDEELQGTQSELQEFEGAYAKEIKTIQDSIAFLNVQISETIKAEIAKLPKAENGKDFDPKQLKSMFEAKFKELTKQRKIETTNIKKEIIELVNDIEIPQPKECNHSNSVEKINYDMVQDFVSDWLIEHKEELRGEKGKPAPIVLKPKDGADGRSIIDVTIKNNIMTIHFSDDTTKEIKLPKVTRLVGGGGSSVDTTTYDNHTKYDELKSMFNSAYSTAFSKITRVDGNITTVEVFVTDTEALKLYTKDINYIDGNVDSVTITNNITSFSQTKTITYDGSNDVIETRVA